MIGAVIGPGLPAYFSEFDYTSGEGSIYYKQAVDFRDGGKKLIIRKQDKRDNYLGAGASKYFMGLTAGVN